MTGKLLYIQQFLYNDKDFLEFFFRVTNSRDFEYVDLAQTTHGADEINLIKFVDPKSTPILLKFLMTENLAGQVTGSVSPTMYSYM